MDSIFIHLLYFAGSLILLRWWWSDLRQQQKGETPQRGSLPGATAAGGGLIAIGCLGALTLLGAETVFEIRLDLQSQQSVIAWHFIFAMLAAAVVEEVIFRGYLVVPNRGRWALLASVVGFSALFAALHPFLWNLDGTTADGSPAAGLSRLQFDFSQKAWFSTAFIFVNSLWFYALRFNRWNRKQSLLPCFAAHLVSNLGVFAIKAVQGYVQF